MEFLLALALLPAVAVAWFFWTELKGAGWQPAPRASVERALELAKVDEHDVLYDLGAGDGRVMIAAAKRGARAVGVEIDPLRWLICKLRLKIGGTKNADVFLSDLFHVSLRDATVVFVYLRDWSNERLKRKLLKELRPNARVVTYHWKIDGWRPTAKDVKNEIWIYTVNTTSF